MIPRECTVAELLRAERGAPLYRVLLARYQLSHTTEQGRGHPSTEEQSSSQLSSWHWHCCCWYRYEYPAWIFQCSWCLLKAATEPPALNTESLESPDYFRRLERCIVWGKSSINRHNRTFQNGIIPLWWEWGEERARERGGCYGNSLACPTLPFASNREGLWEGRGLVSGKGVDNGSSVQMAEGVSFSWMRGVSFRTLASGSPCPALYNYSAFDSAE